MLAERVGFLGAGNMARALACGMLRGGLLRGEQIAAFDPLPTALETFAAAVPGCRPLASNRAVVAAADVLFLAVKPQYVTDVVQELAGPLAPRQLLVSIVAGVSVPQLITQFGTPRVVRVMPNTPCLVGRGASAYSRSPGASPADGELVRELLSATGLAIQVEEHLLDAVTGLSGSGPAYVCLVLEALSDGGVRMGLPRVVAHELALHTLLGTAELVRASGQHPAVLREQVTSPAGTTGAGLAALERRAVRSALMEAVEAATRRAQELRGDDSPTPSGS